MMSFQPVSDPAGVSRELPAFTAVSLGTSMAMVVRQGDPQHVVVEAAPADQVKLETEVVGQQLRIRKVQTTTGPS